MQAVKTMAKASEVERGLHITGDRLKDFVESLEDVSLRSMTHAYIELVTADECKKLNDKSIGDMKAILDTIQEAVAESPKEVLPLGLTVDEKTGLVVGMAVWPEGQQFRVRSKLAVRDFYVVLSKQGEHFPRLLTMPKHVLIVLCS